MNIPLFVPHPPNPFFFMVDVDGPTHMEPKRMVTSDLALYLGQESLHILG